MDHIIGRQHQGSDDLDNLCLSCIRCNLKKGPNIASIDPMTRFVVALYHPRRHVWAAHFSLDEFGALQGLTSHGRVTVQLLDMNDASRMTMRRLLLRRAGRREPARAPPHAPGNRGIERHGIESAVAFKRAVRSLATFGAMNHQLSTVSADETLALTPLQMLVTQTAWANRQMFAALRAVDSFASQRGADLIVRALDHIHVVRCIFQAHLRGVSHGYQSTQRAVLPSLEALDREFETLDRWYVDTTASLRSEELARPRDVRFTDGKVVTMTPAAMLLHVVTHTIHHRGNVDAIMYQTAMPRRRDGIPEFLVSRASAT